MKWPETVTLIRHDMSAYNELKKLKEGSELYQEFKQSYLEDYSSDKTRGLALKVKKEFSLKVGDHNTPLVESSNLATTMAKNLREKIELPDVVFVSSLDRTLSTWKRMKEGWPELGNVQEFKEERLREQEHGLSLIYNDWRVFFALHPEQKELHDLEGEYWYRYPQGENVPDVRERVRSWQNTLVREFAGKRVLAITHHLTILAVRANLERMNAEDFLKLDHEDKPINCGVTFYKGDPNQGKNGKLILEAYNQKLY